MKPEPPDLLVPVKIKAVAMQKAKAAQKPMLRQKTSWSFAGVAAMLALSYAKQKYNLDLGPFEEEALLGLGTLFAGVGIWARQQVQPVTVDEQDRVTPRPDA